MSESASESSNRAGREVDDAALVRRTLAGDGTAFDELVERYHGKIYGLAASVTGNPEDAKDATQNAFLKAYRSLAGYDPAYRFFSWIYRIGLNESLNLVQRRRWTAPPEDDAVEPAPGPERLAAGREVGATIHRVLAQLTAEHRVPIVLRHLHGMSYRQMADVIGIPENRVRSRLFSARVELRRRLTALGLDPGRATR